MYTRKNVEFKSEDVALKGWFYTPKTNLPAPCIIMTHGFAALKEHYLDKFASHFASAGMCILAYDNRNFGESEGQPRFEIDPIAQVRDMRNAISFIENLKDEVDSTRIGLWGTSFSGGVVLSVAALDKRVSCAVSQVPFVSGHHKYLRLNRPEQWEEVRKKYDADRQSRLAGKPPAMVPVITDKEKQGIMKIPSAITFFESVPEWKNGVTLRSIENAGEFEPITSIDRIAPTPILFIVAKKDTINTTDLALSAYSKALEPKKLVLIDGDHFVPYVEQFNICVNAARKWFQQHLLVKVVDKKLSESQHQIGIKARL